ncbi:MAG: precorrin-8X methylmutase [Planctomycetes bacterium]|nr:precorrin-8X methylmutase [Planctomycetota bacterium]MCD7895976.1 precorrin-8X methylmutase [Planctomycetaceae bacterium]
MNEQVTDSSSLPPDEIERRSFAIIGEELDRLRTIDPASVSSLTPETEAIVKRVIHTTADFDYARNLYFSPGAVVAGLDAFRNGAPVVTDTTMALSGINKQAAGKLGVEAHCLIADREVRESAAAAGTTRSRAAVDVAAERWPDAVYVIGNAPTALLRIRELIRDGRLTPRLVVGVPVGFVNVVESKDALIGRETTCIVARGRKGGSNVAAAIVNAFLYTLTR